MTTNTQTSVVVYDGSPDALERRLAAVAQAIEPGSTVIGSPSRTAILMLAAGAPPGTLVLVDLFATDRISFDRPGERLLRRLVRDPRTADVRAVAWSAQPAADVVARVRGTGAQGFIAATLDRTGERDSIRRVANGDTVWPPSDGVDARHDEATWQDWFFDRFGIAWEWWMEPTLVRLASGRERTAVASELVDLDIARSNGHAATRMREIAQAIAGEHRNSAVAVAAAASLVLAQLASHRPLAELPPVSVSLDQGMKAVLEAPSLVRAAGITDDEIADITEIATAIATERTSGPARVGAPAADAVRGERLWAAGRRAATQGAGKDEIDAVVAGSLARLDEALMAIDDARQDELYFPEARAAAALSLLRPGDEHRIPEVDFVDGRPRWRGHGVAELAVAAQLEVGAVRQFTNAADAALRDRRA